MAVAKLREPLLTNEEASTRFWIVDKDGLITKARYVVPGTRYQYQDRKFEHKIVKILGTSNLEPYLSSAR